MKTADTIKATLRITSYNKAFCTAMDKGNVYDERNGHTWIEFADGSVACFIDVSQTLRTYEEKPNY